MNSDQLGPAHKEIAITELLSFAKAVMRNSEEDGRLNLRLSLLAERAEKLVAKHSLEKLRTWRIK